MKKFQWINLIWSRVDNSQNVYIYALAYIPIKLRTYKSHHHIFIFFFYNKKKYINISITIIITRGQLSEQIG